MSPVAVTACDQRYFRHAVNLIGSIRRNSDLFESICVYDLGLNAWSRRYLALLPRVDVITVPRFVPHARQCWTWKPWVWVDAAGETICYFDAGTVVLGDLSPVLSALETREYFVVSQYYTLESGHTLGDIVPSGYFDLFGLPRSNARKEVIAAGTIAFRKPGDFYSSVIEPTLRSAELGLGLGWSGHELWRNDGLNRLAHPIVRDCDFFRHDQTLLNLHFYANVAEPVIADMHRFAGLTPASHPDQLIWHARRAGVFDYLPSAESGIPSDRLRILRGIELLNEAEERVRERASRVRAHVDRLRTKATSQPG